MELFETGKFVFDLRCVHTYTGIDQKLDIITPKGDGLFLVCRIRQSDRQEPF